MPQYELMYLLGSNVADTDVPKTSEQVQKFITDFGGSDIRETSLGKKKLAYQIGKTRNGHYVVVNFDMDGKNIAELDARIRAMDQSIIRYLITNQDEHLERLAKDKAVQAKMNRRIPTEENGQKPAEKTETSPMTEINGQSLDEKIEAALTEDIK